MTTALKDNYSLMGFIQPRALVIPLRNLYEQLRIAANVGDFRRKPMDAEGISELLASTSDDVLTQNFWVEQRNRDANYAWDFLESLDYEPELIWGTLKMLRHGVEQAILDIDPDFNFNMQRGTFDFGLRGPWDLVIVFFHDYKREAR